MKVLVKTAFVNDKMKLPEYAHYGDAGMDVQANISKSLMLGPGSTIGISTGLSLALPHQPTNYVWTVEVRSRSGLAAQGLVVANSPGTIDYGYRGTITVLLLNTSNNTFAINPGMRIAQLVLVKAYILEWVEADFDLLGTSRSIGGFGSSGV